MKTMSTAPQGSQPRFGSARVGIVRAAVHEGVGHVQLSIRTPDAGTTVIARQGERIDLPDGVLTVERVDADPGSTAGRVTFSFESPKSD